MIDEVMKTTKPKMTTCLNNLKDDLKKIRTGRANPEILDSIKVSYYGVLSPLREMASITVPEPTVIAVKPWDRNSLADIELALRNSDLGLSPVNDGVMIRLVLPPMTEDRRKEIVTSIKKMGEQAKVSIRTIRSEAWEKVQEAQKRKEITEDDRYRAEEELNKLITEMNKEIEKIVTEKESEIMRI
jgi:ribosome recycling factor